MSAATTEREIAITMIESREIRMRLAGMNKFSGILSQTIFPVILIYVRHIWIMC